MALDKPSVSTNSPLSSTGRHFRVSQEGYELLWTFSIFSQGEAIKKESGIIYSNYDESSGKQRHLSIHIHKQVGAPGWCLHSVEHVILMIIGIVWIYTSPNNSGKWRFAKMPCPTNKCCWVEGYIKRYRGSWRYRRYPNFKVASYILELPLPSKGLACFSQKEGIFIFFHPLIFHVCTTSIKTRPGWQSITGIPRKDGNLTLAKREGCASFKLTGKSLKCRNFYLWITRWLDSSKVYKLYVYWVYIINIFICNYLDGFIYIVDVLETSTWIKHKLSLRVV